jgi:hypothetical protein
VSDQNEQMIDHLVFACANLGRAARAITEQLGVTPSPGGVHVGMGTRNELLSLGGATYLEVIGPDPDQPEPTRPRPFGVDQHVEPALVAWCARPHRPLADVVAAARTRGIDFGDIASMSRRRPDGVLLQWQLTRPALDSAVGAALPFLIDWGQSPHPTDSLPPAVRLIDLEITTPRPDLINDALELIGITSGCTIRQGGRTALVARIATGSGEVSLSG